VGKARKTPGDRVQFTYQGTTWVVFALQPSFLSWSKLPRVAAATAIEKTKKDASWSSGAIVARRL